MSGTLQNLIYESLCPDGIWQLSDAMRSVLRYQISRLSRGVVSETDTRYPTTPASMRAFLKVFFARHFFQTQNSLIDYMTSQDFLNIVGSGHLRILDVGSGPAVASLAVTDVLVFLLEYLGCVGGWPKSKTVNITYVLNDTSSICLGTGQDMLRNYFRMRTEYTKSIIKNYVFSLHKAFPDNMGQLQRISLNFGKYDIIIFSYVISPLNEENGFNSLVRGLFNIERLCSYRGRVLILQDKFQTSLVRRMSKAIGISSEKKVLTQQVYPKRNDNETYTYVYYRCLYAPSEKRKLVGKDSIA
jgi:ribosomal protein RSM22 (predicted rRNA methylase)